MERDYKNIAIVGAGASGCFCAYFLMKFGYNLTAGGDGGYKPKTEDGKKRISEKHKGMHHTEETNYGNLLFPYTRHFHVFYPLLLSLDKNRQLTSFLWN